MHIHHAKGLICVTPKIKERIYFGICIFCVLLCVLLLFRTFTGRGAASPALAAHAPLPRVAQSGESKTPDGTAAEVTMTEQQMSEGLTRCLPQDTPLREVKVTISADGRLTLTAVLGVSEMQKFAEANGVKLGMAEKALIKLLPKTFSIKIVFRAETADDGGLLSCVPESLTLHDKEIDLTKLPTGLFHRVTDSVNQVLTDSGLFFTRIVFADGAIILAHD